MTKPEDGPMATPPDSTAGALAACPNARRSRLLRLLGAAVFVAACFFILRELGVVEASFGRIDSNMVTTFQTKHSASQRSEGPATVLLRGRVESSGAAVDVLLERLNTKYDHMLDSSVVAGEVDVHVTKLEVSGNAWMPVKKTIHAEFSMTVRTNLARAERPNGRGSETSLSGTIDLTAEGLHSYRAVQRAIGEKIADIAIGLVRKEIADLDEPTLPEGK